MDSRDITQEELDEYWAEEEKKQGKKGDKPPTYTPQEVRSMAGVPEPEDDEDEESRGQWPPHQSIKIRREKRISKWEEGLYEVVVDRTWEKPGKDFYHFDENGEPKTVMYLHVGFITMDGARIAKRMTKSHHEKSFYHKMMVAIYGTVPDEIDTDALIDKRLKVFVKNQVNQKGDEWETIVDFAPTSSKSSKKAGDK